MLSHGIVYYTDNRLRPDIAEACQQQLLRAADGHYVISVSLKPIDFGDNIVLGLERSYLSMFKQILAGVSNVQEDICHLAEHDVLYAPEHFQFDPPRTDLIYYNNNLWQVSAQTGQTLFRRRKSVSQLCAHTRLLIDHYGERVAQTEAHINELQSFVFQTGFEPGAKRISHGGIDDLRSESWTSEKPNIDIRDHGSNLTRTLWTREEFRNKKYTDGWTESDRVPSWPGISLGRFDVWLAEIMAGNPRTV